MNKDFKTNMSQLKNIMLIIILIIVVSVAYFFVSGAIRDNIENNKFITLDKQMQSVYDKIKMAEHGTNDNWAYKTVCSPNYRGDWPTGTYNCITSMAIEKQIHSLEELNYFHDKYFPIIDNSDVWNKQKNTAFSATNDFGKRFVVGVASKDYFDNKTEVQCRYSVLLGQKYGNEEYQGGDNTTMGSNLKDGVGDFFISLRCEDTANQPLYTEVNSTSNIIPL